MRVLATSASNLIFNNFCGHNHGFSHSSLQNSPPKWIRSRVLHSRVAGMAVSSGTPTYPQNVAQLCGLVPASTSRQHSPQVHFEHAPHPSAISPGAPAASLHREQQRSPGSTTAAVPTMATCTASDTATQGGQGSMQPGAGAGAGAEHAKGEEGSGGRRTEIFLGSRARGQLLRGYAHGGHPREAGRQQAHHAILHTTGQLLRRYAHGGHTRGGREGEGSRHAHTYARSGLGALVHSAGLMDLHALQCHGGLVSCRARPATNGPPWPPCT